MDYKHLYSRGIFNKYHRNMPGSERFLKDINHLFHGIRSFFLHGFSTKTILVFPHYPSRKSTIYRVVRELGWQLTNRPDRKHHATVYWEYLTFRKEFAIPDELAKTTRVINLHSRNIGKLHVDKVFQQVFGYSTQVDPLKYSGSMVKKNDINAKHDGLILQGPLKSEEVEAGFIYQILIDNEVDEHLVLDYRVPVMDTVLDFVYIKFRDKKIQFSSHATIKAELKATSEVFSPKELMLLNQFCKEIGLEYGDLDVLRHRKDGKIYVVDVNNTPQGPNKKLTKAEQKLAVKKLAEGFARMVK